jgi:hypothetical protein
LLTLFAGAFGFPAFVLTDDVNGLLGVGAADIDASVEDSGKRTAHPHASGGKILAGECLDADGLEQATDHVRVNV